MYAHVFISAAEALQMLSWDGHVAEAPALPAAQGSFPAADDGSVEGAQTCRQTKQTFIISLF